MERKSQKRTTYRQKQNRSFSKNTLDDQTEWVYGFHATFATFTNPNRIHRQLFLTQKAKKTFQNWVATQGYKIQKKIPVPAITNQEFLNRNLPSRAVHQGIAALVKVLPTTCLKDLIRQSKRAETANVIILDQVTDLQNIGAVLRSAQAFGAVAVVIQTRHAPQNSGLLAKAACGAIEEVPIVKVPNLVRAITNLKNAGFWVIGLDANVNRSFAEITFDKKTALVLGSEGTGLRHLISKTCDETVKITLSNNSNCLNISNAAAIALYEITQPRNQGNHKANKLS